MKSPVLSTSIGVLLIVIGCNEDSKRSTDGPAIKWEEGAEPAPIGPEYDDDDFHLEVHAPKSCTIEGPMAPATKEKRLSLPIEITAKGKREIPISALTFTLEDQEGHEYRPTLAGCAPSLAQRSISRGQKVSGEVAFDVPQTIGRLELRYEPFLIGRKKITARVKVPPAP